MGFLDKVTSFLKSEAKDIGEMAESAKDKFDEGLTAREEELKKTPADKIRDIQENAKAQDAEFDRILGKADAKSADAKAAEEVAELAADVSTGDDVMDALDPVDDASGPAADAAEDAPAEEAVHAGAEDTAAVEPDAPEVEVEAEVESTPVVPPVKSDAQIRYEQAKASADELLDELRGELDADGEI